MSAAPSHRRHIPAGPRWFMIASLVVFSAVAVILFAVEAAAWILSTAAIALFLTCVAACGWAWRIDARAHRELRDRVDELVATRRAADRVGER